MIVFQFGPAVDKVFCLLLKKRIICLLLICEVHQKYLLCPPGKGRKKLVACTASGSLCCTLRCTIALCALHNPHCAAQFTLCCTILIVLHNTHWAAQLHNCRAEIVVRLSINFGQFVESPHISWTKNNQIENLKKTCKNQNTPMLWQV